MDNANKLPTGSEVLSIGTRGSPLALAQANETKELLASAHTALRGEGKIELAVMQTTGDAILNQPLADIGGKGLFTKELDEAMLEGRIALAVHSMKDLPTALPDGIILGAVLPREDVRDAFISLKAKNLAGLPQGAVIGTASLRRGAQILNIRPDLKVINFRGNVQSRLRKLNEGVVDATLLAVAGLNRLGMAEHMTSVFEIEEMLPAVAQGAIGITCRANDTQALAWLKPLDHTPTRLCTEAERAFLARLDGSCRTPIAAFACLDGENMWLRGLIVRPDGTEIHQTERRGLAKDGQSMGRDAAEELLGKVGAGFFS